MTKETYRRKDLFGDNNSRGTKILHYLSKEIGRRQAGKELEQKLRAHILINNQEAEKHWTQQKAFEA